MKIILKIIVTFLLLINLSNAKDYNYKKIKLLFEEDSNIYKVNDYNIKTDYDHRIAMAFMVMGTKLGPLKIQDSNSINTSFPSFVNEFNKIGGKIV